MKIFRIIMVLIGTIGVADTAVLSMWSNINLGIMLPAIIGAPLIIVGIFFKPLRSFTARALWLRYAFFGAYIAYALFMLIVGGMIYTSAHDDPEEGADVLIVLGCAVHGERVSLTLSYRLDRAIEYLNANPNTVAIVSGGKLCIFPGNNRFIVSKRRAACVRDNQFPCAEGGACGKEAGNSYRRLRREGRVLHRAQ